MLERARYTLVYVSNGFKQEIHSGNWQHLWTVYERWSTRNVKCWLVGSEFVRCS